MVLHSRVAVNLTIQNRVGSAEHYYHFLLGFLLPLALTYPRVAKLGLNGPIYVRSCGPMDRILNEVGFPLVRIIGKHEHDENCARTEMDGWQLRHETIHGLDFTSGEYPIEAIQEAAEIVRAQLLTRAGQLSATTSSGQASDNKRVTLVNRSVDPFYNTREAELPTSGLQRRSIGNFDQVRTLLGIVCPGLNHVVLENTTLSEQISLFASADVIIAQHGAALANVIWCRPGTRIIEIAARGYRERVFPPLSKGLGLDHRLVHQEGEHGDCDIPGLISNVM